MLNKCLKRYTLYFQSLFFYKFKQLINNFLLNNAEQPSIIDLILYYPSNFNDIT